MKRLPRALVAALALAAGGLVHGGGGGESESFMPKGGRTLLLEVLGPQVGADALRRLASTRHTEAQWTEFVAARAASLSEHEKATLVAYLSVNMPAPSAATTAGGVPVVAAALPRDGRELAWNQCQFCHSLFSSQLTQSRDVQGWRSIFLSPFHRELKMTPQEREEFARYSAINMPMKVDDVPAELRF